MPRPAASWRWRRPSPHRNPRRRGFVAGRHVRYARSMTADPRPSIPELTTERLRLRGFADEDRAPFAAMNGDPEVMEHFPATLSRPESDAFVDRILERWAVDRH